jgi:ribosomal subunit interface protein
MTKIILFLIEEYHISYRKKERIPRGFVKHLNTTSMEYIIQSPNKVVSLEKEEIIQDKFRRFEKKLQGLMRCDIVLRKEKNGERESYIVEGRLYIPGNDLFAKEQGTSYEIAAEKVCIDLENQIRKQKEKKNKRLTKPVDSYVSDEELE